MHGAHSLSVAMLFCACFPGRAGACRFFNFPPIALIQGGYFVGVAAIFAATIAMVQLDIKRVLAYSTISQLGYMFMGESVHNYPAAIFHLTTHAYFKALLFLAAGAVIHALAGEQDVRRMGGLRDKLQVTFWAFVIAALAISGIPPLAGFWSKDEILSSLLAQATGGGGRLFYVLWGIGVITAGLTSFYMFRLVFGIFMGGYRGTGQATHAQDEDVEEEPSRRTTGSHSTIHEAPGIMTIPLIILAILSVIGGFVGSFAIFGLSRWHPFANFLMPVFADVSTLKEAPLSVQWFSTVLSVILGLLGILVAWRLYGRGFQYKENKNPLYQLVFHKYYVDEILSAVIVQPILWFVHAATRWLEGRALDGR